MSGRTILGNVLDVLPTLEAESVHCVVTSPPFYGLRDYGTGRWEGGDAACNHTVRLAGEALSTLKRGKKTTGHPQECYGPVCRRCGAWRVDVQIGLEATPEAYLNTLVRVFREVRRVLRADGTAWVEIGDSYSTGGRGSGAGGSIQQTNIGTLLGVKRPCAGYKPKDLMLMPFRVAAALQADGWWLRQIIIWARPNPMPESVTDRCTTSHTYVFLLAKSARYFFDADAIREPHTSTAHVVPWQEREYDQSFLAHQQTNGIKGRPKGVAGFSEGGRNRRSVWTIATQPLKDEHYAAFPEALVEPCILAGTSAAGCCAECGAPRERVVEKAAGDRTDAMTPKQAALVKSGEHHSGGCSSSSHPPGWRKMAPDAVAAAAWQVSCSCAAPSVPCRVLDPFHGSGTTGRVAERLGRDWLGVELNPAYVKLSEKRTAQRSLRLLEGTS